MSTTISTSTARARPTSTISVVRRAQSLLASRKSRLRPSRQSRSNRKSSIRKSSTVRLRTASCSSRAVSATASSVPPA